MVPGHIERMSPSIIYHAPQFIEGKAWVVCEQEIRVDSHVTIY